MTDDPYAWQIIVTDDPASFRFDARRVYARRQIGPGSYEYITALGPGAPETIEVHQHELVEVDFRGLAMPADLLEAMPGPDRGEVGRLEASLDVERRRVDQVLDRLIPPQPPRRRVTDLGSIPPVPFASELNVDTEGK